MSRTTKKKYTRSSPYWEKLREAREAREAAKKNITLLRPSTLTAAAASVSDRLNQFEARIQNQIEDLQEKINNRKQALQVLQDMVKSGEI